MSLIFAGSDVINRATTLSNARTYVDLANPISTRGIINSIDIWAATNMTGVRVGVFFLVSANVYQCRSSALIGSVTAGSLQTFSVSLHAEVGDYIGYYCDTGFIEYDISGGSGMGEYVGEAIDPGDQQTYTSLSGDAISLRGYGTTYEVGGASSSILSDPSLVLYLPLYKLDGGSFRSLDAYGHLCVNTGAIWRPNGSSFGGDDKIRITFSKAFPIGASARSLGIWVKKTGAGAHLIAYGAGAGTRVNFGFYSSGNDLYFASGGAGDYDTGYNMDTNWHYLEAIYDGNIVKTFVDLVETPTSSQPRALNTGSSAFWVGASSVGAEPWVGVIREVYLNNVVLSSRKRERNYLEGKRLLA